MANLHTPERQPGESFASYKARRAEAKAAVRTMRRGPTQMPMQLGELSTARFFLGQHTNAKRNSQRKTCRLLGRRQYVQTCKQFNGI